MSYAWVTPEMIQGTQEVDEAAGCESGSREHLEGATVAGPSCC